MNHPIAMCCLCLSASNSQLFDLFSKSEDSSTYFNKIASTLSQLADILNELDCDNLVCKKCCNTINMIYNFNRICLNNVRIYSSEREKLKAEIEEKYCKLNVETKNAVNGDANEEIFIKTETNFDPLLNDDEMESLNISENILVKQEEEVSNSSDSCQIDFTVDQLNLKKEVISGLNEIFELEDGGEHFLAASCANNEHGESSGYIHRDKSKHKNSSNANMQHHTSLKITYICDICKKCFVNKAHLDIHRLKHTDVKQHVWDEGENTFNEKSTIEPHKLSYSDEKLYSCDVCNKQFKKKYSFDAHKRIHTGEKPYVCDLCDKAFAQKSNLTGHKRTHTRDGFICNICRKAFTRKTGLRRHMMLVHNHLIRLAKE